MCTGKMLAIFIVLYAIPTTESKQVENVNINRNCYKYEQNETTSRYHQDMCLPCQSCHLNEIATNKNNVQEIFKKNVNNSTINLVIENCTVNSPPLCHAAIEFPKFDREKKMGKVKLRKEIAKVSTFVSTGKPMQKRQQLYVINPTPLPLNLSGDNKTSTTSIGLFTTSEEEQKEKEEHEQLTLEIKQLYEEEKRNRVLEKTASLPVPLKSATNKGVSKANKENGIPFIVFILLPVVLVVGIFSRFFKKPDLKVLPHDLDGRLNETFKYGIRKLVIEKLDLYKNQTQEFLSLVFDKHTIDNNQLGNTTLNLDLATDFETAFFHIDTKLPFYRVSELIVVLQKLQKYEIADLIIDDLTNQPQPLQLHRHNSSVEWVDESNSSNKNPVTFV